MNQKEEVLSQPGKRGPNVLPLELRDIFRNGCIY